MGIGVGTAVLPVYPGARSVTSYILPLPYFVYRGKILRTDHRGIRGIFFHNKRLQLSFSGHASPPVYSGKTFARAGMPNLSLTFQVGPALQYVLMNRHKAKLELRWPVRAAFTLSMRSVGWVTTPRLNLTLPNFEGSGWALGASFGPNFADREYHSYYYAVSSAYARPNRPAYSPEAGYGGSSLYFTATRRLSHYWIGAFISYDNLAGASFVSSPLVRTQQYLAAGIGISWIFATSSQLVKVGEP